MWTKLSVLLNCIPLEKHIASICTNSYIKTLIKKSYESKSWNTQPLTEDIHLRSFNALKLEHLGLKFDINNLNKLSLFDEVHFFLCLHFSKFLSRFLLFVFLYLSFKEFASFV